jgi:hypothetical protein
MPIQWNQTDSSLPDLPVDMVFEIMKYLEPKQIAALRQVNKQMYESVSAALPYYIKSSKQFVDATGEPVDIKKYIQEDLLIIDWINGIITTREMYNNFKNFDTELSVRNQDAKWKLINDWHNLMSQDPQGIFAAEILSYVRWLRGQGRLVRVNSGQQLPSKMSDRRAFAKWRENYLEWRNKS